MFKHQLDSVKTFIFTSNCQQSQQTKRLTSKSVSQRPEAGLHEVGQPGNTRVIKIQQKVMTNLS